MKMNQKPLRILFVSRDKFPPFRVDVAVLFGKEMVRKGHSIDWILQSQDNCQMAYKTKWTGGYAWVGPTNNGSKIFHRAHKHLLRFSHMIRNTPLLWRKSYDIIQVKDCFFSALAYLFFAKLHRVKYIYWLSYPVAEASLYAVKDGTARYPLVYLFRGALYKILLYKILMKYADHIYVQSEQMKQDIKSKGIDIHKMTPIAMGVEQRLLRFDENSRNEIRSDGHSRLVYLGTLIRLRRIDFIIRVLAHVLKEHPDVKLYLVGRGESPEDLVVLKDEADRLGISDAVVFTGFLNRPKALRIVRSADVCISPFYPTPILNSTSPTKLIEYMALGKAVVANDHPEQKSILQESGAGLCVPFDEAEFAKALLLLLKNPSLREEMGNRGKEWVTANRAYPIIADRVEDTAYRCLRAVQNEES